MIVRGSPRDMTEGPLGGSLQAAQAILNAR
jgi:hypothetical protein